MAKSERSFQKSIPARHRLGIRLMLGLVFIIGVLFAGSHAYVAWRSYEDQKARALSSAITLAQLTSSGVLAEFSKEEVNLNGAKRLARNAFRAALSIDKKRKQDSLAFALLLGPDGIPLEGSHRAALLPPRYRELDEKTLNAALASTKSIPSIEVRSIPLKVKEGGGLKGTLVVGVSTAKLEADLKQGIVEASLFLVGVLLALVIYLQVVLRRMVIAPIVSIGEGMDAVEKGDFTKQIEMRRPDEFGRLANSYNLMAAGLREREHLKDAFNRYVSPAIYDLYRAGKISFDGEMRRATVLFSDIRGFTSLSEASSPQEVVQMLNEYFKEMVDMVNRYEGFLNKFIGDAIMAVYNVPGDQDDPEYRAVKTALDMLTALEELNAKRARQGKNAIQIGIGINTGPVVAGNLGHPQRMEYTVIGDAVNLAQRLESTTKAAGHPLLVSASTYERVKDRFVGQELEPVQVKGKEKPVRLFAISGEVGAPAS